MRYFMTGLFLGLGIFAGWGALASGQGAGNSFVQGLAPDWEQPLDYPDAFDPMNGPPAGDVFWNAWCVPTAAACLIGHWEDVNGCNGLSDGSADGNQFIPAGYGGPAWGAGSAWYDFTADGNQPGLFGPNPKRGLRPVEDLGWYLDTNGTGIAGFPHVGTFYKDVSRGLKQFFRAKAKSGCKPARSMWAKTLGVHPFFGGRTVARLVRTLRCQIDRNQTAIAHFRHWNLVPAGPGANPGTGDETEEAAFEVEEYYFGDWTPGGGHGEDWSGDEDPYGLGHAVLVVGYTLDGFGNVTHLIVHDNWPMTLRNVKVPVGQELVAITIVPGYYLVEGKPL